MFSGWKPFPTSEADNPSSKAKMTVLPQQKPLAQGVLRTTWGGGSQQSCQSYEEQFNVKAAEMKTPMPTWTNVLTLHPLLSPGPLHSLAPYHPPSTLTEPFCTKFGPGKPRSSKHRLPLGRKLWFIVPPGCRLRISVSMHNSLSIYNFNPVQHLWNIPFLLLWSKCKYYLAKGNYPQGKSSSEQLR